MPMRNASLHFAAVLALFLVLALVLDIPVILDNVVFGLNNRVYIDLFCLLVSSILHTLAPTPGIVLVEALEMDALLPKWDISLLELYSVDVFLHILFTLSDQDSPTN